MKQKKSLATLCFFLLIFLFIKVLLIPDSMREMQFFRCKGTKMQSHVQQNGHTEPIITCNSTNRLYDLCLINGPTLLDPTTATFYGLDSSNTHILVKTRPYPRKYDVEAMKSVKEVIVTSSSPNRPCSVTHNSTALVFSTGGFTGNVYHQFNEGFIPLFITVHSLNLDRDVTLVVSDFAAWWAERYKDLIPQFSNQIINMDNQTATHCFRSVIVGLISHGSMTINRSLLPRSETLQSFQTFLQTVYGHGENQPKSQPDTNSRPILVLLTRKGNVGRVILNQNQLKQEAEAIGFEVIQFEPRRNTTMVEAFRRINSSHAMLGVHGAAMTHLLFQRRGAVMMQVMPIGTNWLAATYGKPAREMGLEYMEYRIGLKESSLRERYGEDELVLKNPTLYTNRSWSNMRVYMKEQNVRIDLNRFKGFLELGYEKARRFMDRQEID